MKGYAMAYTSTTKQIFHRFARGSVIPTTGSISFASLAGRILLATIFLLSGLTKFTDWNGTAQYMSAHGVPMIPLLLPIAGIIEIAGGLAILLGAQARVAATLLFLYLIPTTFVFHNFWGQTGMENVDQMHHFLKNLAIMGGLAMIVGLGPGAPSIEAAGYGRQRLT